MKEYLLLIIPIVFAIFAVKTNKYVFKALQTLSCIMIVVAVTVIVGDINRAWSLILAFLFSIIGDYFLSNKEKKDIYFIYGIGAYFLAHIMYLVFCVLLKVNIVVLLVSFAALLVIYLAYYAIRLKPAIEDKNLSMAVIAYLLISCGVLACAISSMTISIVKALVISSIALIVFSDTLIAEADFIGNKKLSFLILPTYYLAQILLTVVVLMQ